MSVSSDTEIGELLPRRDRVPYSLNELNNMQYNNFSVSDDVDINSADPDTFLQETTFTKSC